MSETLQKIQPLVDAMTTEERHELMDYMTQLECEALDAMLDRRRHEYESGAVKGVPAEEVFSKLRNKHS